MGARCDVERVSCGVFHGFGGLTGILRDPTVAELHQLPAYAATTEAVAIGREAIYGSILRTH